MEKILSKREFILEEAKRFLTLQIQGKINKNEVTFPWRKSWEFCMQHSLRVEKYSVDLAGDTNYQLREEDVVLILLGAILHDIARLDYGNNHGEKGAKIVQRWIKENQNIEEIIKEPEVLIHMIESHSDKNIIDSDIRCTILKDADILDEIGALSILMCSHRIDKESPYFLNHLKERLEDFEIQYCIEKMKQVKTNRAKVILEEKKNFIENFINQLHSEIQIVE